MAVFRTYNNWNILVFHTGFFRYKIWIFSTTQKQNITPTRKGGHDKVV